MINDFGKVFFRGLITLLPIALTIYIIYSAVTILEGLLGGTLREWLPIYIPGLGLLMIIALVYGFGLLWNSFLTGRLLKMVEEKLQEIPLIKVIYSPLREVMNLFGSQAGSGMKSVVLVDFHGTRMLGVVTREDFSDLKLSELDGKTHIAVYFPFSYAIGGMTLLVPRDQVTAVNLPIERAMTLGITAWVKAEKKSALEEIR